MTSGNYAIKVTDLSKVYRVYSKKWGPVLELMGKTSDHYEKWALKDIDFGVTKGEVFGIIGSNGAGKSTLLKIIAGRITESSGSVDVHGHISAILELGTSFNPQYSGRENALLGCMNLGLTRAQAKQKLDWIIDFSELASVIDQPFLTYSSGMQGRLTFSTAISVEPDVLIIDEALATGDAYFVNKCLKRIREICDSGATVLFVAHSTYLIMELCDRAMWIENGEIREIGESTPVAKKYEEFIWRKSGDQLAEQNRNALSKDSNEDNNDDVPTPESDLMLDQRSLDQRVSEESNTPADQAGFEIKRADIAFTSIKLADTKGNEKYNFHRDDDIVIQISWKGKTSTGQIFPSFRVDGPRTPAVSGFNGHEHGSFLSDGNPLDGEGTFELRIKRPNFGAGEYSLSLSLTANDFLITEDQVLLYLDRVISFKIKRTEKTELTYLMEIDVGFTESPISSDNQA